MPPRGIPWTLISLAPNATILLLLSTWVFFFSSSAAVHALAQPNLSSSSTSTASTAINLNPLRHGPLGAMLSVKMPHQQWTRELSAGYARRLAADPTFPIKSVTEVVLAASTQLVAEYHNRGSSFRNLLFLQIDFVVPAVLTAVLGKYLSLWKTAPTLNSISSSSTSSTTSVENRLSIGVVQVSRTYVDVTDEKLSDSEPQFWGQTVPTNAFQPTLTDGITVPTLKQRVGSLLAPMLSLFRAGCLASFLGYILASVGMAVRTLLWPSFVTATQPVNIVVATLYTGCFMAVVSNLRYQLLQGVVEPAIDSACHRTPLLRAVLVFAVKVANGIIGSSLAIAGMQLCGLQKMK